MDIINQILKHNTFGEGKIINVKGGLMDVDFKGEIKSLGIEVIIDKITTNPETLEELKKIASSIKEKRENEEKEVHDRIMKEIEEKRASEVRSSHNGGANSKSRKNPRKMIFCNVAWYEKYDGTELNANSGGKYVEENGFGHEMANYKVINGKCFGFVQARGAKIDLERINYGNYVGKEKLEDVLVVWTAKNPTLGSVVIGFYDKAIAYRAVMKNPNNTALDGYHFEADAENAYLLPTGDRTLKVPRASEGIAGGMGQSNIWYADDENPQIEKFVNDTIKLFESIKK